jgi:hypothetical protein
MDVVSATVKVLDADQSPPTKGRGRVRLRAVQAALGVAFLETIPGGFEVANLVGIDPVAHAKRRMLIDLGKGGGEISSGHGFNAKAFPRATKQATVARGLVRLARSALRGTRYAAILAKRGALVVTVVSTVTSGVIAYRELTTVGFAALGDV